MYSPDIINLRNFYSTPFGESVRALITEGISDIWQEIGSDITVGMGYATPYLSHYLDNKTTIIACMPSGQGAVYWPQGADNLTLIAHDSELPFAESSLNRVLLVHSMENSEQLSWLIQEVWRILTPNGRMLAVVPNRSGMWSRSSRSPFGYGRPFSIAQMRHLLSEQQFAITRTHCALFMPPTHIQFLWKASNFLEKTGKFLCRFLGCFIGGVLLVEAEKKLYSDIKQPVVEPRKYRSKALGTKPAMTMERIVK